MHEFQDPGPSLVRGTTQTAGQLWQLDTPAFCPYNHEVTHLTMPFVHFSGNRFALMEVRDVGATATASSTEWWPGMKLRTNGPYLLPRSLVAVPLRRSLDHRHGAHERPGMFDLRGIGSSRNDHNQATRR